MSENDSPPWALRSGRLRGFALPGGESPSESDFVAEVDLPASARFEPIDLVGAGGMGEVHKARDRALGRDVAKKVIHGDLHLDHRTQRSFVREARITAQLDHPHIVPVHDIGVDADGRMFFTMKLVEGQTLSERIAALPEGPIAHDTLLNLVDVVVKICDALAFAHSRGVLHCDLKPGNVMVGEFGQVYLMDWGVARMLPAPSAEDSPRSGGARRVVDRLEPSRGELAAVIGGTPSQMSPEQALGSSTPLDERSDVFLVGATLYQIVTRHPPYEGDTVMATLVLAASGRYAPIESFPAAVRIPRELRRIIERAMHAAPESRYESVEMLREDLVRFIRGNVDFPRTTIEAGAVIIREGEIGETAYRIVEGKCLVTIGRGEERRVIREMGPGECFGETAILSPGPRTATVTAIEPTILEIVTREELETELSAMRPWMASFVRTLAQRFREREESGPPALTSSS
jgi:eukaryotic-like serine/threonine-protein kinase